MVHPQLVARPEQADEVAKRASLDSNGDDSKAVARCFQLILTREPTADETEAALEVVRESGLPILCRTLINTNEFAFLP